MDIDNNTNPINAFDPTHDDPINYQIESGRHENLADIPIEELTNPASIRLIFYFLSVKIREAKSLNNTLTKLTQENDSLKKDNIKKVERNKYYLIELIGSGMIGFGLNHLTPMNSSNENIIPGIILLLLGFFILIVFHFEDIVVQIKILVKKQK